MQTVVALMLVAQFFNPPSCPNGNCPYVMRSPVPRVAQAPAPIVKSWILTQEAGKEPVWRWGYLDTNGWVQFKWKDQPTPGPAPAPKAPMPGPAPVPVPSPVPVPGPTPAPAAPKNVVTANYGLVQEKIFGGPEGYILPDNAAGEKARAFLAEDQSDPLGVQEAGWDEGKLHLTIVGSPEDTAGVMRDLKSSPELASYKDSLLVQEYRPGEWGYHGVGIPEGTPSIVLQNRKGKVVWRASNYKGGPGRLNAAIAEELRRINPNYDPKQDPGPDALVACPLGFTRDHWPAIVLAGLTAALMLWKRKAL